MSTPTYAEIAASWDIWIEYVDTDATMTAEEFDAMSIEDKVALQVVAFGAEIPSPTERAAVVDRER
ncbi:hypothetical protein [Mesorhizobium sp. J428]|uniref:hypothetical protein n=1 Tax=Mesorhizobium sp. J428 TaxID=2898440 RepID=UPI0021516F95|nr:hypothetical protein [Mesorhizobium sp. J428]MCR5860189.1 hypothetical protein [Mesorhizobium sp. J428]MCR5860218.1 hypothetical protein [Mesorhizobium sp. J428]